MPDITEIRITLKGEGHLRAYVSITLNDAFVIRGLRIIQGNRGLFLAMPSRQQSDGSFQDVAHPISARFRNHLEVEVIGAYLDEFGGGEMLGVTCPLLPKPPRLEGAYTQPMPIARRRPAGSNYLTRVIDRVLDHAPASIRQK